MEMMNALDIIDTNISIGDLLRLVFLEDKEKKKVMKKVWSFFRSCMMTGNAMRKFETFY